MVSRGVLIRVCAALVLATAPSVVSAQTGSIAGVVRDTTGSILPGVVVEASSPALIEKTRSATTDEKGQYKIIDLRPGVYTVTFTLPGFSVIKREGIELTTQFTAAVNAELRVGALAETATVTGESPVVDTQRVQQVKTHQDDVQPLRTPDRGTARVNPRKSGASFLYDRRAPPLSTRAPEDRLPL